MLKKLVLATLLALALVGPASASAAIRTASIDDPLDNQPVVFDPQYRTDVQHVDVTYDESGTIRVAFRFFQAEPMDALTGYVALAGDCGPTDLYLNFNMTYDPDGFSTNGTVYLSGYSDALNFTPTLSSDGRTLAGTVSHAALANRDFRCVDGGYGRGKDSVDDLIDERWFTGYAPPPPPPPPPPAPEPILTPTATPPPLPVLNSGTATAEAQKFLAKRFGAAWTNASRRWLKCPKAQVIEETDEDWAYAICQFEYRQGRRYRGGVFLIKLEDDVLRVRNYSDNTFSRTVRTCSSISSTKKGYVNGVRLRSRKLKATGSLTCRYLPGSAGMVNDVDADIARRYPRKLPRRFRTYLHGTNRGGFEEQAVFPCRVKSRAVGGSRRYSMTCKNKLGDFFRYSFVAYKVSPRTPTPQRVSAPKPQKPSGNCDPNYSGCLDPNASDYDCAGGSGDGPKYTGLVRVKGDDHYDLDRDGDGVACDD